MSQTHNSVSYIDLNGITQNPIISSVKDPTEEDRDINITTVEIDEYSGLTVKTFSSTAIEPNNSAFARKFFKKTKTDSDILPPVTRWVSPDMKTIAVERQPANVSIKYVDIHSMDDYDCDCGYDPDYDECSCDKECPSWVFNLNIPWTIWFFQFSAGLESSLTGSAVYARNSSLTSFDDRLYSLPVTNLYGNGGICWGHNIPIRQPGQSLSAYVLNSINVFWTDEFNNDLVDNVINYPPKDWQPSDSVESTYAYWETLSMDDVLNTGFNSEDILDTTFGAECKKYYHKSQNSEESTGYHLSNIFRNIVLK